MLFKLAWAGAFFCAFYLVRLAVTCSAEYEADAVAVRLIGKDQVILDIWKWPSSAAKDSPANVSID